MFGSHLSIAGGMVNALLEAKRLKMECVQVFTKNQRQWAAKPLEESETQAWLEQLKAMGWDANGAESPARVVSHNSYLINMASSDAANWKRSVASQRIEIERCEALHIPLCVAHPGGHLSAVRKANDPNVLLGNPTREETAGLKRIIKALDAVHRDLPGYRTITCLETTVGSGTHLGYDFHHLAMIRDGVKQPERVGFCFDTCHVSAAGYDMTTVANAQAVWQRWDSICGLSNLRAFHLNDSIGAVGSRRDRHAHIGTGTCGIPCFQTIVNHPAFQDVPKILETPKETNPKGMEWDVINIRKLKRMAERPVSADNEMTRPAASAAGCS